MPEDDKIWYDRVLFHDHLLRGSFKFRGLLFEPARCT